MRQARFATLSKTAGNLIPQLIMSVVERKIFDAYYENERRLVHEKRRANTGSVARRATSAWNRENMKPYQKLSFAQKKMGVCSISHLAFHAI